MKYERIESTLFEKVTRETESLGRGQRAVISLRKSREGEEEFYDEAEGTRELINNVGGFLK